jgi:hypothetical protein
MKSERGSADGNVKPVVLPRPDGGKRFKRKDGNMFQ